VNYVTYLGEKMNLDSIELSDLKIDQLEMMGENLLVVPFEKKEPKGFIIPENKKEKPTVGKIVKVGNGHLAEKKIEMVVKIGDIIIFNEWSAKLIDGLKSKESEKIFYIKQSDVIGFVGGKNVK
jgi:co-chaperonin GroES (HSP10)